MPIIITIVPELWLSFTHSRRDKMAAIDGHFQIDFLVWALQWRHNEPDGVSNHLRLDNLFNRLFRRRSKETSKPRVTGLCEGNSLVTGEFHTQRVRNVENASIWWRHHESLKLFLKNVPNRPIYNKPALLQRMAWHRIGDRALSEPMVA